MSRAILSVLAGTNGAGKSSVGGAMLESAGTLHYNPDQAAKEILEAFPGLSLQDANALAWEEERQQLIQAIETKRNFSFETTLGGKTFKDELIRAAKAGMDVRVWYVGLASVELHIQRVATRVLQGGHDIPEGMIRKRYDNSRRHLVELMPWLSELRVFDNSAETDPATGSSPAPVLLLHMKDGKLVAPDIQALARTPDWAKPLVEAALELAERG